MRPDDGGGDFRGINPDRLGDLIKEIGTNSGDGAAAAPTRVNSWMSHARRLQMDTSRLTKITRHLSWAQDQLPMLRRRQSLAMDEEKRNKEIGLGSGMVSSGAGDIGTFKTQSEAQKAAKKDAKAYKDGDMSLADYMKKLEANQTDPDYCKAAMDELGETALYRLQDGPMMFNPDNPEAGTRILATTVATAMRNGTTFKDENGNEDLQHLSGLLAYADFPTDVVANLGKQCLAPGNYMYGEKVWEAMGNDPAASTKFLHDNMDVIPGWMKDDSDHHGGMPDYQAKAFAEVIKAGTLGDFGADQDMAAENTEKLVTYYGKHPDESTHPEIQAAFGQIIMTRWDDVQSILTDPAPADPGAGHVFVDDDAMRSFINEAMHNPKAAAELMAFSKQKSDDLALAYPKNPEVLHASGMIDGIFSSEMMSVYNEVKQKNADDAAEWNSTLTGQLTTALNTGVEVAFDPGGAAASVSKAAINDVIGLVTQDLNLVDQGQDPEPPSTVTWRGEWQKAARLTFQENNTVGNPQKYADAYCDGKPFLRTDGFHAGEIVEGASPKQLQAYNEWLKDQDLAQASRDHFLDLDHGRDNGNEGVN
ncbi:hypothetical protein ACGFZS_14740 [Streptomyces sp. NPDC048288]|uniref:hypothetical protein n=1 Tax=Streptomyces sp. NPDC048288 TaxID=3365529 RepID=UPI003712CC25